AGTDRSVRDGRFYVIGSGEGRTISEVCQQIADKVSVRTGQNVPIHVEELGKTDAFEMRDFVADTRRFQQATGWKPMMQLAQGIDVTIESLTMAGSLE